MESILKHMKSHPDDYLRGHTGSHFEQRIESKLRSRRYTKILQEDFAGEAGRRAWKQTKQKVLEKTTDAPVANTTKFRQSFLMVPYGSQNYPDIILFENQFIVPFELKFSRSATKPVWNSGLPRPNGIYIFGSAKENEITFFLGKDVISAEDAKALHDHLNWVQNKTGEYNKTRMATQPYGFAAYVRKAFEQKKTINKNAVTNFFSNEDKSRLERNVIAEIARLSR